MKKALVLVLAIAITVGAVSATKGSRSTQDLNKQVKTLQTQVKQLLKRVGDLEGYNSCDDKLLSVAQFGDNQTQKHGYLYSNADGSQIKTTALDSVDPTGLTADQFYWVTVVKNDCVTNGQGRVHVAHALKK